MPAQSDAIELAFETENVLGGTYHFELVLQHNDPLQPPLIAPVTFSILAPPLAGFSIGTTLSCDGIVQFTDLSLNEPTTWMWDFGDGHSSGLQHPAHSYSSDGLYDISLTACNSMGCDMEVQVGAVAVGINSGLCDTTIIGISDTHLLSDCGGILFDDGGPEGDYGENVNTIIIIEPPGAETVTLTIHEFWLESCCAFMSFYDGNNVDDAPEIGTFSGFTLPLGGEITSTGGAIAIQFRSVGGTVRPGFEMAYSYSGSSDSPAADFFISDTNPPFNLPIQLTDNSDGAVDFFWDFGDGNLSYEMNPQHTYTSPGGYEIKLFVSNCFGNDFIKKNILVQGLPQVAVSPSAIELELLSGASIFQHLLLQNNGDGGLVYEVEAAGF